MQYEICNIRILGFELELACNGGSFVGISLKIFARVKIPLHELRLQASSSSIPIISTPVKTFKAFNALRFKRRGLLEKHHRCTIVV